MNRTAVPLYYYGTDRARVAFGRDLEVVAQEAYFQLGRVADGHDIHHHQFRTRSGVLVAIASRRRKSGAVEVEIDLVTARMPARTFTVEATRRTAAAEGRR